MPHIGKAAYTTGEMILDFVCFVNGEEKARFMPTTLAEHLAQMPYKALRGMATRLGLRQRPQQQKADWRTLVAAGWQERPQAKAWLGALSPAATTALHRLWQAEQIPAFLFWETYGVIRHVTATQHWSPPPWQAPVTVSEELYYSGLLCSSDGRPLTRTDWVTLPSDLRPQLALWLELRAEASGQKTASSGTAGQLDAPTDLLPTVLRSPAWPLCHDVGQWLIYLHSQPGLRLQHGRWLTLAHLAQLNERLWAPNQANPLPTHRRSPYLRLLSFLADVGELHHQGLITPKGWDWLRAPPIEQLAWLWQAWCTASPTQRQDYALPAATVGAPWPQAFVRQLQALPPETSFTPADLVHGLLRDDRAGAAFWAAHFCDLSQVDQTVAALCAEILLPFAILAPAGPPAHYGLTPTGIALSRSQPLPFAAAPWSALPTLTCQAETYLLDLSALPNPPTLHTQAQCALYGAYTVPSSRTPQAYHRYEFTAAALARAAATGYGLPNLCEALAQAGVTLSPAHYAQLAAWHAQGRQLTLTQAPLLRTTTPAQLAALTQLRSLQPALGEILAPTVVTLTSDLATFAAQLQTQGYYATVAAPTQAAPLAAPTSNPATLGALWLAGRIYARLGEHLPLPLPPPLTELDHLFALLPATQQAVLQAQADQVHEHLLALLDNLPFTPPPQPTDPEQWHPVIRQAIAAEQRLQITYFSAGRNITTRRLLDPYWLEEYRNISYLRAYCHSAGRVLTFRLDRIAEMEIVSSDQGG